MSEIKLLDCTLRDGGYVNDWKFGQKNLISIFERIVDAGVDIVEVGFLDERRPFDIDRSIMPDTKSTSKIWGDMERKKTMVVAMIDFGTCSLEFLEPCEESFLDGIRVIFKKHLMQEAMAFCKQVKALGYKVFSQLVSITTYSDAELLELVELVNDVKPYAVSMVDTYGLLHPDELLHFYEILDEHVLPEVQIGFHAHNNFQMAYANSLTFIQKKAKHNLIVDGTLYGMGKNAGNAPLELLAMRLNEKYDKCYHIDSLLEGIDESIMEIYSHSPWGYKTFFYLCGKNKCHPNYLSDFMKKRNLSISKLDLLLSKIGPEEKKLLYDKDVAEYEYERFIQDFLTDEDGMERFKREVEGKELLIIGPGKNIQLQYEKVQRYVEKERPYIISINYVPEKIKPDCVFITNGKRYHDAILALKDKSIKVLATTNVECRNGKFDFVVQREPLLELEERIFDNSFLMLVKLLMKLEVGEIACAGFDGYSDTEDNYCNPGMEYYFIKQEAAHLNQHVRKRIFEYRERMNIHFITYSAYDAIEDINGAAI